MKKQPRKIMTIEDLATLMQGEFLVMHKQFAEVHKQFTEVHDKFAEVHEQFAEVREEIGELRTELKEEINKLRVITKRIDLRTQNQVDAVYEDTTILKKDMKQAKRDIVALKAHVGLSA